MTMEALAQQRSRSRCPTARRRRSPSGTTPRRGGGRRSARASRKTPSPARSTASSSTSRRPCARTRRSRSSRPKSPEALDLYRHSTAHLTANAVKRLFPTVQIGIGPAIENGYYYDFSPERPFTPEDLAAIEAEMRKIVAEDNPVERLEMSKDEAVRIFEGQNDALKVEIIRGIPDDKVSCYRQKDFIDLCRGPHVPSTGRLGVFKLTHTAGAYWKGDEKNPMLQRIYARLLPDAEGARRLPEAAGGGARPRPPQARQGARSRRVPPLGAGLALLPPEGRRRSTTACSSTCARNTRGAGYQEVMTPQIFDAELFKLSGHYAELLREHVLDGDRRAGVRRQADELPRPLPALQDAALVLPRPARALRRLRPAAPLRALRRDGRA